MRLNAEQNYISQGGRNRGYTDSLAREGVWGLQGVPEIRDWKAAHREPALWNGEIQVTDGLFNVLSLKKAIASRGCFLLAPTIRF